MIRPAIGEVKTSAVSLDRLQDDDLDPAFCIIEERLDASTRALESVKSLSTTCLAFSSGRARSTPGYLMRKIGAPKHHCNIVALFLGEVITMNDRNRKSMIFFDRDSLAR